MNKILITNLEEKQVVFFCLA